MSLRIAVALAAIIGAGVLGTTTAQARPMWSASGVTTRRETIVVKTNERRLYLVLDPDHAVRYPVGVGKSGKQWAGHHPDRRQNTSIRPGRRPQKVKRDKPEK